MAELSEGMWNLLRAMDEGASLEKHIWPRWSCYALYEQDGKRTNANGNTVHALIRRGLVRQTAMRPFLRTYGLTKKGRAALAAAEGKGEPGE